MKKRNVGSEVYELEWIGPVVYSHKDLESHPLDPQGATYDQIEEILSAGGIYVVIPSGVLIN